MAELDAECFQLHEIGRGDAEYVLSTFKGIHERSPLFPGGSSVAERVLGKYEAFGAAVG